LAGRREFKESLGTREYSKARERYSVVHAQITQIFKKLQQGKAYAPPIARLRSSCLSRKPPLEGFRICRLRSDLRIPRT